MNPAFVIVAVRSAIRIGRTAQDAFEQYAQEQPILFVDAEQLTPSHRQIIVETTQSYPLFKKLLAEDEELKKLWESTRPTQQPNAEEVVYAAAMRFRRRALKQSEHGIHGVDNLQGEYVASQNGDELISGILVGQWAKGKGPVRPMTRVILAMADVGLEYVGSHPQVLGIGGEGEKLVGAIAAGIAEGIPDAADRTQLGPRDRFAERLAALVLRAGLKTLVEKPGLVFSEDHLRNLLIATLPPVLDAMPSGPESLSEQVQWRKANDALFGPALSASMETIAANPVAYLGRGFKAEKVAGVMVTGLLQAAAKQDAKFRFSQESMFALFKAASSIAAENPALILGDLLNKDLALPEKRKEAEEIVVNLFRSVAGVLAEAKGKGPFGEGMGEALAIAILEGMKNSGPTIFNPKKPWEKAMGDMLSQILDGFSDSLLDENEKLKDSVFSMDGLLDLARVFVTQVSRTPHLLIHGNEEIRRLVANVAKAVIKDEHLLLSKNDWIKIAGVAAQEAALNPGKLFGINENTLDGMLASEVISRLLVVAGEGLKPNDGEVAPVMIGDTLREAIVATLRGMGGNLEQAFKHKDRVEALAQRLNKAFVERKYQLGGKEWQRLYMALLPGVLRTGHLPNLTDAKIKKILTPI